MSNLEYAIIGVGFVVALVLAIRLAIVLIYRRPFRGQIPGPIPAPPLQEHQQGVVTWCNHCGNVIDPILLGKHVCP